MDSDDAAAPFGLTPIAPLKPSLTAVFKLASQRDEAKAEAKLANERADAMQRSEASMKELIDKQAAEIAALKAQLAKLSAVEQALSAFAQADREYVSRESGGIARALNSRESERHGLPLFVRYY